MTQLLEADVLVKASHKSYESKLVHTLSSRKEASEGLVEGVGKAPAPADRAQSGQFKRAIAERQTRDHPKVGTQDLGFTDPHKYVDVHKYGCAELGGAGPDGVAIRTDKLIERIVHKGVGVRDSRPRHDSGVGRVEAWGILTAQGC